MKKNIIESLLEERIGLDAGAIGRKVIEKAYKRRMDRCGAASLESYAGILADSSDEWNRLIEMVVVPETWFFRNRKVFDYLARFVKDSWLPENSSQALRILSIPCSTGEEPYSIAMTLMDAGLSRDRFRIVGMDISENALKKARNGFYGQGSFRGKDLDFRDRYFQPMDHGYQLSSRVSDLVRFKSGNVLDAHLMAGAPYDVVFCRNLMIYMSPEARDQTLAAMSRLLKEKGVFFCGHAERQTAIDWGFEAINETGVFACRKRCRESRRKDPSGAAANTALKATAEERRKSSRKSLGFRTPSLLRSGRRHWIGFSPMWATRGARKRPICF
jgi:chemotaxis protein methyltransferase WspC